MVSPATANEVETQLVQVRVPLEQAADIFATPSPDGRVPIVVLPDRPFRLRIDLLLIAAAMVAGAVIVYYRLPSMVGLLAALSVGAIALAAASVLSMVRLRVPEGVNALLAIGGRHWKTIGSGMHLIAPWVAVTHLVTRRDVPFDMPAFEMPTSDHVRATLQALVTFQIADPYRFVYSISAYDFDLVLQAACQDAFRQLVHRTATKDVMGLTQMETSGLREALDRDIASYGVTISKVHVTYARPPADFLATEEARQLAIVKRAEQVQQQELALRRMADEHELERQRVLARAERASEELRRQIELATLRRQLIEQEAENEALRLARLEERVQHHPTGARVHWEFSQLEVARALAGNTRAVLQVGNAGDIGRVLMVHNLEGTEAVDGRTAPAGAAAGDATPAQAAPA